MNPVSTNHGTSWGVRARMALLLAVFIAAAVHMPAASAASSHQSTTPMPAASTQADSSARIYLPLLSGAAENAPAAITTPGPTPVPMDMSMGGMEPVAPDWLSSCASNTVPFEAQSWWMNDFGHAHLGFCAPVGQKIKGVFTLKVRMILHFNPGTITLLQTQIDSSNTGQTDKVNVTCPITDTCAWNDSIAFDTAAFPNDGWHHIRVRLVVKEPDGKELVVSNFVPVYLNNGKPVADFKDATLGGTTNYISGRGWYTDVNYTWATIFSPPTASARIKGATKFTVRPAVTSNPKPISLFIVKLDATHTDAGTTLYSGPGTSNKSMDIPLDTTKLANGWHSLLARTEAAGQTGATGCTACSGTPQTHAGVAKIWFYVQN